MTSKYAGKEITTTVYLSAEYTENKYSRDDKNIPYNFNIHSYNPEGLGDKRIVLHSMDITMVVPDLPLDLDQLTINKMREEQNKIKSEAQVKINNIEEQIQNMLCLPSDGENNE